MNIIMSYLQILGRKIISIFKSRKELGWSLFVLIVLVFAYICIYLAFYYQIGFPACMIQNDDIMQISASDWLSFLGSYLGFAGSLIMAILVYQQSKRIDVLTISEYSTSLGFAIENCSLPEESHFETSNIFQSLPNSSKLVYTFHCSHIKKSAVAYNSDGILLFVKITNNSKVPINELSFTSIEICEIKEEESFEYSILKGKWDPADKKTSLLPHESILRCFFVESTPKNIEPSWMKFRYKHGCNNESESELIIYLDGNGKIIQLDSYSNFAPC